MKRIDLRMNWETCLMIIWTMLIPTTAFVFLYLITAYAEPGHLLYDLILGVKP